ncbi:MAG: Xaa-Pro dipeptidase [Bacteroidetes Order II. Incertae sedis bacterium]|nr:Xaa-Pro dipeptidase [Bacteroidetes Order II. bacterium]
MENLFKNHLEAVSRYTTEALAHAAKRGECFDGIVFHAGAASVYHADDHDVWFHTVPHFVRFAPVVGPDHLVIFKPGAAIRLIHVVPQDFWYESPEPLDHPYAEVLDVTVVSSFEEAIQAAGALWKFAYIGNSPKAADALGLPQSAVEPTALLHALDWFRAYKTEYEVACVRLALERTAEGYRVAKKMTAEGRTAREIHAAYLAVTGQLDRDTPYGNIIGWDTDAATLHYTAKKTSPPNPGHTFLIDAGAATFGYASDITRTYLKAQPNSIFAGLLDKMDALELACVAMCTVGADYSAIHVHAHKTIAGMLSEAGVLTVGADEAFEKGLSRVFFPHGLGHHLGIQVHDVGGRQVDIDGTVLAPDPAYPWLRTTRPLEVGHLLTIEPGLYFIPLLLNPHRSGEHASCFNWTLVDELLPLGGIRVEDNVYVTNDGPENLSRGLIGDHR